MGQWAQMLRSSFAKGDEERDRGLTTPDNIIRYDDIRYDDPSTEDMMRGLYAAPEPRSLRIFHHLSSPVPVQRRII